MDPPLCQHCKQYGFDCTFFLPITETRFKKKRLEEEAAAAAEKADVEKRATASPREGQTRPETRTYGACVWRTLFLATMKDLPPRLTFGARILRSDITSTPFALSSHHLVPHLRIV